MQAYAEKRGWLIYAGAAAGIAVLTVVLLLPPLHMEPVNAALLYLFPVLLCAVYGGKGPAVFAAVLGIIAFDFFFVPPELSFDVEDLRYLISFAVYLAVALMTSALAERLKRQARQALQRERQTAILYGMSRSMSDITELPRLTEAFCGGIREMSGLEAVVYVPDGAGRLQRYDEAGANFPEGQIDSGLQAAERAMRLGEAAGRRSPRAANGKEVYLPLLAEDSVHGAVSFRSPSGDIGLEQEERLRLAALCDLAAGAIARIKRGEEARLAVITAESERMRAALLDSVSHELRTPLAEIIGSSSGLLESGNLLTGEEQRELLHSIHNGAQRMNRLVANLLGMVRLEGGMLKLRRDWLGADELLGAVLRQLREARGSRSVSLILPEPVPLLRGDPVLLEQMMVNLISNAFKYSPEGSRIELEARSEGEYALLIVRDEGIGITEEESSKIFDKFYRGGNALHLTGTGLGLAIAKGVAELHGGSISAGQGIGGRGTAVTVQLPLDEQGGEIIERES
ncbi:DUF4118 domain-containing protein [Paenibacillus pasadenensis]|uniref:DUF4118 domain-containing protein n=1 Tax=Paenibacillus pasadenensis TaxID=217090 RepID=UPI00203DC7E0|nr:DUF4118 domain-containing protein [Paenibacillus pasadenensis]MCM3747248.1 DUF4118 domain-containing protein [Paenibacillus pasadenensis]